MPAAAPLGGVRPGPRHRAVLDQSLGPHLCLDGAVATPRPYQQDTSRPWRHRPTAGFRTQHNGHHDRHAAYHAAVHGPAALRHNARDRSRADARGGQSRRQPALCVLARVLSALAPGTSGRHDLGFRHLPWLLCNARTVGRRPRRDGFDAGPAQRRALFPVGCRQLRRGGPVDHRFCGLRVLEPLPGGRARVRAR